MVSEDLASYIVCSRENGGKGLLHHAGVLECPAGMIRYASRTLDGGMKKIVLHSKALRVSENDNFHC